MVSLPSLDRRNFMTLMGAFALTSSAQAATPVSLPSPSGELGRDPAFWAAVRDLYEVDGSVTNLENGYWGIMAKPVLADYLRWTNRINVENTAYARTSIGPDWKAAVAAVAQAVGFSEEEIALTRGATEALQLLITNYNKLKPGDTVVYSDLDYDSMQYAMEWLAERRGVTVVKISMPEPATRQGVLDAYAAAIAANPKLKLLLLTHVSHRTGLLLPVKDIAAMAREKGIDVILDAAHSWGQVDFKPSELGIDFIGFNLHKWIGAPIGNGFLYIAKNRLGDIDTQLGDHDHPRDTILSRVHTGTVNFAGVLTLPSAIALHQQIGTPAKAARVRYLRDLWVNEARKLNGIEILTPDEPGMSAGITSFRLKGQSQPAQVNAFVKTLRDKYKVLTVIRTGVANGACIRVAPAIYTTEADVMKLVDALRTEVQ